MKEMTPQQRSARTRKLKKIRADEEGKILAWLKEAGTYSETLTPLINTYLDAHVIYTQMYEEWRDEGFPATRLHQNKAGAVNEMKHPLAQQVADWNTKKASCLNSSALRRSFKNKWVHRQILLQTPFRVLTLNGVLISDRTRCELR
ncbi:terminase small subunit [Bacillus sonorensis]|nr:terminase small subunit [Bacillus sonorensis]